MADQQMNKKRKFVVDGVFKAEINELFMRELAEDGYSCVEVCETPARTEIVMYATSTYTVLGERGRRIKELTCLVQKRFNFADGTLKLYVAKIDRPGLFASAEAESLRHKLLGGLAVRRASYAVQRFVMESGAKSCEIIVSGKLRGQRAKYLKFKDGYMISSGHPVNLYVHSAVRHVLFKQGVLGIKVRIMMNWDSMGRHGPCLPLPDDVMMCSPNGQW
ncbi:hypothetical protein L7F22_041029 [Adiantum nelumboides]|nr:hypothetical protein [Adiantum nelumboides]